ncbi:hypothetical protein [Methanospirillum sp.]|uniref:hypothetical protein n=2 Tax=Methanospirillum sp. TaxID=45200 RepID=UPI002B78E17F|nr:hypothetical protein [Methanospirillum sp.]HQC00134.1 hypothetical protein [Methanospirillum sp.]
MIIGKMTSSTKISTPPLSDPENTEGPLSFEKVWLMFKETDKKFQETDKKLNKLERLFTSQWGKLIESLVDGDIINILNQRGIAVTDIIKRRSGKRDGVDYEFDIIAINGTDIVIVEVKTTLRPENVRDFIKKLKMAKAWMPEYSDKKVYGAVAFLTEDTGTASMAEKKGLFVIRATGDSASIINDEMFIPKPW